MEEPTASFRTRLRWVARTALLCVFRLTMVEAENVDAKNCLLSQYRVISLSFRTGLGWGGLTAVRLCGAYWQARSAAQLACMHVRSFLPLRTQAELVAEVQGMLDRRDLNAWLDSWRSARRCPTRRCLTSSSGQTSTRSGAVPALDVPGSRKRRLPGGTQLTSPQLAAAAGRHA